VRPLLGLYLGVWLIAKHRSTTSIEWAALALEFVGAFTLRRQVKKLYWEVDRTCLKLGYVFTALFGPWYVNYQLRPMWPV